MAWFDLGTITLSVGAGATNGQQATVAAWVPTTRTYTGAVYYLAAWTQTGNANPQYTYVGASGNLGGTPYFVNAAQYSLAGSTGQFTLDVGSGGGGTPGFALSNTGLSLLVGSNGLLENGVGQLNFVLANTGTATANAAGVTGTGSLFNISSSAIGSLAPARTNNGTLTVNAGGTGGTANFTLTATDTVAATVQSTGSITVGQATAGGTAAHAASATFGSALQGLVAAGGVYSNLASYASGQGCLGSVATILAGTNAGSATTVTMAWRPRATDEIPGTAGHPPIPGGATGLISDVVKVAGVGSSDLVVLEMYLQPGRRHGRG